MGSWQKSRILRQLARRVVAACPDIAHVDVSTVLFLEEFDTSPKALARCYSLADHPIEAFTHYQYAVVFYEQNLADLSPMQRAIVMWHELSHIPEDGGKKLVEHNVKDFAKILHAAGVGWTAPGATVPDILNQVTKHDRLPADDN